MMLEGIKIVEMATYIAAPAAAGIMADWGAEVIKIEPKGGDPIRQFFNNVAGADLAGNPIFDLDNRSKRSIALDVSKPEAQEIVRRLIARADIFITNTRPQSLIRAGLDYDSLAHDHPGLIYASVTGYGLDGAERDRPGFDLAAFWARSGLASLTSFKGSEPLPMRVAVGDHTTGLGLAAGILAALYERTRTGKGRLIETSLLRTGIYVMGSDLGIHMRYGRVASTKPRKESASPLNTFYQCGDGRWICLLQRHSGEDWSALAKALGAEDLLTDERFASARARRTHAVALIEALDQVFARQSLAELAPRLDAADLVWAPVQTPAEVLNDPQAKAAGAFVEVPDGHGGHHRAVANPIRAHGAPDRLGPVPGPGEHGAIILADLGYDAAAIQNLADSGALTLPVSDGERQA